VARTKGPIVVKIMAPEWLVVAADIEILAVSIRVAKDILRVTYILEGASIGPMVCGDKVSVVTAEISADVGPRGCREKS